MGLHRVFLLASLSSLATVALAAESEAPGWVEVGAGLPETGQWRNGFDLADLDGDGRLDLVHGPARRQIGPPVVFLGTPAGGFELWGETSFPDLPYDYGDAAAADFDGDGNLDIALAIHSRGLVVLGGDGHGRFHQLASFLRSDPGLPGFSSRALAAGDVNGDGRPDLVAVSEGGGLRPGGRVAQSVRVLMNSLPETWRESDYEPGTGRLFADALTLGDFDGRGTLDIATATNVQGQQGVLFWGDGTGLFAAGDLPAIGRSTFVSALVSADFDGDRGDELAIASFLAESGEGGGSLGLWKFSKESWRGASLPWPDHSGRATALGAGDLDGDGDQDLVALSETGAVLVFLNSNGKLEAGPGLSEQDGGRGCRGYHVQLADLDADGRDEVVAGFADEGCSGGGALRAWSWQPGDPDGFEP